MEDPVSALVQSVILSACIRSSCETLSLSICYWSLSFLGILSADLRPSHPVHFNRAEHQRAGQSDNMQLKTTRIVRAGGTDKRSRNHSGPFWSISLLWDTSGPTWVDDTYLNTEGWQMLPLAPLHQLTLCKDWGGKGREAKRNEMGTDGEKDNRERESVLFTTVAWQWLCFSVFINK